MSNQNYRFDPYTGEPIGQQPKYDPYTGKPIGDSKNGKSKKKKRMYDPQTGGLLKYDPKTGEKLLSKWGGARVVPARNEDEVDMIVAWFWRRDCGNVKIKALMNDDIYTSQNGSEYLRLEFEVFYQNTGVTHREEAPYFLESGKAHLRTSNIYVSTKAKDGGFCGFYRADFKNYNPNKR